MLFEQRFAQPVADGVVTLTFRRWKRRQAAAGRVQRVPFGRILVDSVEVVSPEHITPADARRAGYPDVGSLVADLRGTPDLPVYRIAFRFLDEPDPRAELASSAMLTEADADDIDRRLDRLDRASAHGAWTRQVLRAIADRPATRAADLAAAFGRDKHPFKTDVRKLKNLGLTISLERGYRLSPRGEAYLRHVAGR